MHDNDVAGEYLLKCRDELPCERDLRHEDDDLPPACAYGTRRFNVDTRLTAACNSVQQIAAVDACCDALPQGICRMRLRRRQRHLSLRRLRLRTVAVACLTPPMLHDEICREQVFDSRACNARLLQYRRRRLCRIRKEAQRARLCRFARKRSEMFFCECFGGTIVFFIARPISAIRMVFLAYNPIAEEFFYRFLRRNIRQCTAELRDAPPALPQEEVIDGARTGVGKHRMPFVRRLRLVDGKNPQSALPGHEKPHHLR